MSSSRNINLPDYPMAHPPMLEWLRANGFDTAWVVYDQEVLVEDGRITAAHFLPSEDGSGRRIKINPVGGEPVFESITLPLISAPENHGL